MDHLQKAASELGYELDSVQFAQQMDAQDPLASLRNEFVIPTVEQVTGSTSDNGAAECTYLCGNSLGLQPKRARQRVCEELDEWGQGGVTGHFRHSHQRPWVSYRENIVQKMAPIVGAKPMEVGIMNTLTTNIHLMLAAFYRPSSQRYKIMIESKAFPSDHYAVQSQIRWHELPPNAMLLATPRPGEHTLRSQDILDLIAREGSQIAVVMLSGVQYYTGQVFDIEQITAAAHAAGCVVGWDLAHAVGNVPLQLHDWNVDFACWCTYKYMNSGPGGIAGFFVHDKHADNADLRRLIGWWAHDEETRFDMTNDFVPAPGAAGFEISNTPILTSAALLGALEVFSQVPLQALFRKSALLTAYLDHLLRTRVGSRIEIITPPAQRGAQLSLLFKSEPEFEQTFAALSRAGVVCDERKPNCIRIAPVPLYNSFMDVWRCAELWDEAAEEARLRDMEREWAVTAEGGIDYYKALNVSPQASDEDIRDAYKRLSRLFHPDRHHGAEQREWAQQQFHVINRAYEVLTDAQARAAYDHLGENGIRTSKALGHKVQTRRDLLDAFEREARRQRIEEIEQWAQSKSKISVDINTMHLTSISLRSGRLKVRGYKSPLSGLFLKHSFSADLAPGLTGTVTGRMLSQGSLCRGNVIGTLKYTSGPQSWASVSMLTLPPHMLIFKAAHQPTADRFISTEVIQHTLDLSTPPAATVACGQQLSDQLMGSLTMRTGNGYALGPFWISSPIRSSAKPSPPHLHSSVMLGLTANHGDRGKLFLNVGAGVQNSLLTASYMREIDSHFSLGGAVTLVGVGTSMPREFSARIGDTADVVDTGKMGLGDVIVSVEMASTIDSWTKVEWKVEFGLATGVRATATLHRLEHCIQLPLLLTPLPELVVALGAVLLPVATGLGLHYGVLRPRRRRAIEQRMAELREQQRFYLHQQKRRAEEAVRLMAASVERSRDVARSSGGLVIESALYGDLPFDLAAENSNALQAALDRFRSSRSALSATDEPRACDVTLALHALITSDQLVIAAGGSKHSLPGFYDPAFGSPKKLFVRYRFRGALHEAMVLMQCRFFTSSARRLLLHSKFMDFANQQIKPVSIGQLLKYRRQPLSAENILDSVAYSQAELPVRLAKRVISFHHLPFIVGTNPHIARVYNQYYEAFDQLHAFPEIKDLDAEWEFTRALERQTQLLVDVIPAIAQGFLECKQYMPREHRTAFINDLIRSRIGLRVIGEQHVALSFQFREEQKPIQEDVWVGTIHTRLMPARMIEQCSHMVQSMCEMHYGTAPSYYIDGDVDESISYIPSHFEYITCELLKNAFRATVEFSSLSDRSAHPPIQITITKGDGYVGVRIRDQGGGISKANLRNVFEYSWSSMQESSDSHGSSMAGMSMQTNLALQQGVGGPIAGLGFGLPMARLYAEYFGGSLDIVSMEGYGCDVFLKLGSIEGSIEEKQI
ncbi:Kynureninase (L-kynurenine hydrolase) [Coemansia sp. RSA 1290]|nr:Kynureninase (L-kynurenine hydrolase) [Coemansia sp. RSA 1290]